MGVGSGGGGKSIRSEPFPVNSKNSDCPRALMPRATKPPSKPPGSKDFTSNPEKVPSSLERRPGIHTEPMRTPPALVANGSTSPPSKATGSATQVMGLNEAGCPGM